MDFDQAISVLIQLGIAAVVTGILYGLHHLMDGFEMDEREQMERQRNIRREAAQERVSALEQLSGEQLSLLSPALKEIEHVLLRSSRGIKPKGPSVLFSRPRIVGKTGDVELSPVDETEFQCVPVGISLEEEILR